MDDLAQFARETDKRICSVTIECNECNNYFVCASDAPVWQAYSTIGKHERKTGHTSFDIDVDVASKLQQIDCEITVGDTIESS